jgi:adenylate cyclase
VRGKIEIEFADLGEQTLKNITRPLSIYRVGSSSARHPISPAAALPLPDKPSIAVLPFANLSGDPEQEYFADGMVEEIITALARAIRASPTKARRSGIFAQIPGYFCSIM